MEVKEIERKLDEAVQWVEVEERETFTVELDRLAILSVPPEPEIPHDIADVMKELQKSNTWVRLPAESGIYYYDKRDPTCIVKLIPRDGKTFVVGVRLYEVQPI